MDGFITMAGCFTVFDPLRRLLPFFFALGLDIPFLDPAVLFTLSVFYLQHRILIFETNARQTVLIGSQLAKALLDAAHTRIIGYFTYWQRGLNSSNERAHFGTLQYRIWMLASLHGGRGSLPRAVLASARPLRIAERSGLRI